MNSPASSSTRSARSAGVTPRRRPRSGRNRQRSTPQQPLVFRHDPQGHLSLDPGGVPGASRLMWLKAIANTAEGQARDDAQPERTGVEPSAGCVSVRNPATLPVLILGGADDAYPLEDRACPRSFSSSETASRRRAATRRPELPVQRRRGRHASLRRHSPSPAASAARATPHVAENASSTGRVEAHASASSNASPPRSRAIRMRRSASVHVTVPRIQG